LIQKAYQGLVKVVWVLMVLALPVTSFPFLANMFGGTSVAPLPVVFLVILLVAWYLPGLIKEKRLPRHAIPLLVFVIMALVSTLLGQFLLIPTFRNIPPWRNIVEAIITLGMGISFYLVFVKYLDSEGKLKHFIRLINYSGLVLVIYAIALAVIFYIFWRYPEVMRTMHGYISSSYLFARRTTGFAYEPSWYAHLLNIVYIPIWLGLTLKKTSVHKYKLWKISFENILLILGLVSLFLSFSRIGWLAFLVGIAYVIFIFMHKLSIIFVTAIQKKRNLSFSKSKTNLIQAGFWVVTLGVLLVMLIIAGVVMTKVDPRMEGLFDIGVIQEKGFLEWAGNLIFAERLIYWNAGFRVFLTYPIFGVGLGRSGYFFQQTFDSFGYKLPEIVSVLIRDGFIPNAKNLWVRILAETGFIGFSIFIGTLFVHWKSAHLVEKVNADFLSALGFVGQIFLVALLVEGFSMDTFGLPFIWVSLALIAAGYRVVASQKKDELRSDREFDKPLNPITE
jgi:hypothetical protein